MSHEMFVISLDLDGTGPGILGMLCPAQHGDQERLPQGGPSFHDVFEPSGSFAIKRVTVSLCVGPG